MSTAPHRDDDNNQDRNHDDDESARIENAAAQLRVPIATIRYWRTHRRLWRAERRRPPGSGSNGA
ncbi:hypothetical protein D0Z08_26485 [Nocardioides immobilis]|uniref:MerR family transcriptional regulator n=1 Tax=Nocardioides immobilis TaxID=2049295 RepID=A0A417XUS5_9ACTN|nr:hypothetical protein [Nocardioides immobilis]RHW24096.1 hypothetical protein D0Z08_26485 [Nocardioides immobilis]